MSRPAIRGIAYALVCTLAYPPLALALRGALNWLIGGFALVAYPARYGSSGIMTFIVNHDGVVYEKNLGANTSSAAKAITAYNPDAAWIAVPAAP